MDTNTNVSAGLETNHILDLSDRLYKIALWVIGLGGVFVLGQFIYNLNSLPQNMPREISVTGEGKAYAKPDIAVISFGVHTEAIKSQDAVNQNNEKMNAVIKGIKELGVEDKDIQTTLYNLTPLYDFAVTPYATGAMGSGGSAVRESDMAVQIAPVPPGSSKQSRVFSGYSLDQQVVVKIRNFDNINAILDKATSAGANTVGQLDFTVDDPEKFRSQAREEAIKKAKEKLNMMVKESGLQVGRLVNMYEGYSPYPTPFAEGYGGAIALDSKISTPPQVQSGQMEIVTTVTLVYKVR